MTEIQSRIGYMYYVYARTQKSPLKKVGSSIPTISDNKEGDDPH